MAWVNKEAGNLSQSPIQTGRDAEQSFGDAITKRAKDQLKKQEGTVFIGNPTILSRSRNGDFVPRTFIADFEEYEKPSNNSHWVPRETTAESK